MERLPHIKYTKELRLEAVLLVTESGLSVHEASMRVSLPKSTLESWLRAIREITEYIEVFYNRQRIQKQLGYLSPAAFERRYYEQRLAA
jgi:transposase-like protein